MFHFRENQEKDEYIIYRQLSISQSIIYEVFT